MFFLSHSTSVEKEESWTLSPILLVRKVGRILVTNREKSDMTWTWGDRRKGSWGWVRKSCQVPLTGIPLNTGRRVGRYDYDYKIKISDSMNVDTGYVWNFPFQLQELGLCHPETANDSRRDDSLVDYGRQKPSRSLSWQGNWHKLHRFLSPNALFFIPITMLQKRCMKRIHFVLSCIVMILINIWFVQNFRQDGKSLKKIQLFCTSFPEKTNPAHVIRFTGFRHWAGNECRENKR